MSELGIAFRFSRAYVTDAANDAPAIDTEHTDLAWAAGATLDNGLTLAVPIGLVNNNGSHGWATRDRSAGYDPRVAGIWLPEATGDTLTIGVGASGTYAIRFASGDPANGNSNAITWQILDSDGTTVLATIAGNPAGGLIDATGAAYSVGNWPANNTRITVTLSGSHFTLKAVSGDPLCYVSAEFISAGSSINPSPYYREVYGI